MVRHVFCNYLFYEYMIYPPTICYIECVTLFFKQNKTILLNKTILPRKGIYIFSIVSYIDIDV